VCRTRSIWFVLAVAIWCSPAAAGPTPDGDRPPPPPAESAGGGLHLPARAAAGIQWFGTLESGLRVAARSGRPILLVAAAPHCAGVPGIW
jgi:hypothetical protein